MAHHRSIRIVLLAGTVFAGPALAADVTPQRLANPEPQNWLMNHRTYDGQRFSPLERINKANVKGLKLAYAVPIGGGTGDEYNESTPLAEDGFLYVVDSWGVLYKIDGRSGTSVVSISGPQSIDSARQLRNIVSRIFLHALVVGEISIVDVMLERFAYVGPARVNEFETSGHGV
jgi:glucose dehydrogenase